MFTTPLLSDLTLPGVVKEESVVWTGLALMSEDVWTLLLIGHPMTELKQKLSKLI